VDFRASLKARTQLCLSQICSFLYTSMFPKLINLGMMDMKCVFAVVHAMHVDAAIASKLQVL
jgi:energy-converting hydrogenase Eha subunit C